MRAVSEGPEVAITVPCGSCKRLEASNPPPRDRVAVTGGWTVAHAFNANLEGWLVVLPTRHVEALDELTAEEADELGALLRATTAALRSVCGCSKTYVLLLAESAGFSHVHFHVVPRSADFDDRFRGAKVFGLLGNPELPLVTDERKDELSVLLRRHLVAAGAAQAPEVTN
jgi:diadenosine tetraphosphate (Ap4A) HIT family hydrolase